MGLLDLMLQSGLSVQLIDTVAIIADAIPDQRLFVQQRLLDEIAKVLGGNARVYIPPPSYASSWIRHGGSKDGGAAPNNNRTPLRGSMSQNIMGSAARISKTPSRSSFTWSASAQSSVTPIAQSRADASAINNSFSGSGYSLGLSVAAMDCTMNISFCTGDNADSMQGSGHSGGHKF